MSRFNRYFRGWLGLLDGKVGGQTPAEFADFLQPGLDAWPFLYAQTRELISGSTGNISGAAEGFNAFTSGMLVPDNEIWLVENFSIETQTNIAVGDIAQGCCAVQIRSTALGLQRELILGDPSLPFATTNAYRVTCYANRRFIALPGDQLGFWANTLTYAGAYDFLGVATVSKAPI